MTPFLDGPPDMRQVIYTTHAIEPVNMGLRKLTTNRGSFPSDEALTKLAYLALCNISQKWTMPIRDGQTALTGQPFATQFAFGHDVQGVVDRLVRHPLLRLTARGSQGGRFDGWNQRADSPFF